MLERKEKKEVTRGIVIKLVRTIVHDTDSVSEYFWVPRIEVKWVQSGPWQLLKNLQLHT